MDDPKKITEMTITLMEDGQVRVNGPLNDVVTCYGMIEPAKDAIRDRKHQNSLIQAVGPIGGSRFRQ